MTTDESASEDDDSDDEESPYSRLDRETAERCGLWLEEK